jgi:O-antigen biosynthesis protein
MQETSSSKSHPGGDRAPGFSKGESGEKEKKELLACVRDLEAKNHRLESQLVEKDRLLKELERRWNKLTTGTGWAVLQKMMAVRFFLFPRGSIRERMAKALTRKVRRARQLARQGVVPLTLGVLKGLLGLLTLSFLWKKRTHGSSNPSNCSFIPGKTHGVDEILDRIQRSRGVLLFVRSVPWSTDLMQRPNHLARTFSKIGYLTIYDDNEKLWTDDGSVTYSGFVEIERNLFLYRGPESELHKIQNAVLWCYCYNFDQVERYHSSCKTVYDLIDDFSVHSSDTERMLANHRRALKEATVVAYVARHLAKHFQERPDAIYLPNGVEAEHFVEMRDLPAKDPMRRIVEEGKPIVGYYGSLAEWFDYQLMDDVARRRPDWNFVLIGPRYDASMEGKPLFKRNNVHWLGPRSYLDLPSFLHRFDVATIPFVINEVSRCTSPLKLYEYFAGGKPVITTPLPECEAYPEVTVVKTAEEMAQVLDSVMEKGRDGEQKRRTLEVANSNSWLQRALVIDRHLAPPITFGRTGLVSVVLPVYNQSNLLREAVESVLRQTYQDFELILLNDGSKDNVERVLGDYVRHPKVRLLNQPNLGLPKALSNGFDFANGEYWTWTSADNLMEPNQLDRMVQFLKHHPDVALVYADYLAIDDKGNPLTDPSFRPQNRRSPRSPEIHLPLDPGPLNETPDNFLGACFLYRGYVGRVLGDYWPALGVEDYDYWMRMNRLFKIAHLDTDEILYRYRVHDNTLNARASELGIYERLNALLERERQRGEFSKEKWTICADPPTREWLEKISYAPHEIRPLEDRLSLIGLPDPTLLFVREDRLPMIAEAAGLENAVVAAWFGEDRHQPYLVRSELRQAADVCFSADPTTVERLKLFHPCVFQSTTGREMFQAAIALAKERLFERRQMKGSPTGRTRPDGYWPKNLPLKVLLQVDAFIQGGLEKVVHDLAIVLRGKGCEVELLVLGRQGVMTETIRQEGIPVHTLPEKDREKHYGALLRERKVDVVNAHFSLFGGALAQEAGIPFVQTVHTSYVWLSPDEVDAHKANDPFTSAYVCVSPNVAYYAEHRLKLPPGKMVIFPNGIETQHFCRDERGERRKKTRESFGFSPEDFIFLNVATISWEKSQILLVRSMQGLVRRCPKAKLVLLGRAQTEKQLADLRKEIHALGLDESVVYAGYHEDAKPFYEASDAFVLPSIWEGHSLAMMEAMSMKLPVVATDVGNARDVLNRTRGELLPALFSRIVDLDYSKLKKCRMEEHPRLVEELTRSMERVCEGKTSYAVSGDLISSFERTEAYGAYKNLYCWLIQGGDPRAARGWGTYPHDCRPR